MKRGSELSLESRAKMGHFRGQSHTPEAREKMHRRREVIGQTGGRRKGHRHTLESREKMREHHAGGHNGNLTHESREKMSRSAKRSWAQASRRRFWNPSRGPSSAELKVIALIEENGLPFRYVGTGDVIIAGLCPDFIHSNGKKQLVEIFGDYWHRNDDGQQRIERFDKFGFKCLIVWERELNDLDVVLNKLQEVS